MTASQWLDDPAADGPLWAKTVATAPVALNEPETRMLARHSLDELLGMPDEFKWLAQGLVADPTYGQIAGELKTLKSTVAQILATAIASGQPVFDHFNVTQPGPVLQYVGEGGRILWTRRQRRINTAMGVDPAAIGDAMQTVFEVAPIQSATFAKTLERDLRDVQPRLVVLDPLYAYHGTATNAARLHEEGALLTSLSQPIVAAGASLFVVNHFNQTGGGDGLKRITMAGSGEWVDSWLLTSHRESPNVEHGRFRLRLDVGSRQWGGSRYDLDIDLGTFDALLGAYDGDISWQLSTASAAKDEVDKRDRILDLLTAEPFLHTREAVVKAVGGNAEAARSLLAALVQAGDVDCRPMKAPEGETGRLVTRSRYGPAHEPRLASETKETELPA